MATYPNEAYPTDAQVEGLDGTADSTTGLSYVAKGVGPNSTPTYEVQYNRRLQRQNAMLAVVKGATITAIAIATVMDRRQQRAADRGVVSG